MINLKFEEEFTSTDSNDRIYHCEKYYLSIPTAVEMNRVKEFLGNNEPGKLISHYWTHSYYDLYLYRMYYDGEEPEVTVEEIVEEFKNQYYVIQENKTKQNILKKN